MKDWKKLKGYGVLLHISSLPSPYGIGDIGSSAKNFIDWLAEVGANTWQVLPTSVPDETNCPYACFSAFGGNPLLIDPKSLLELGLLNEIPPFEAADQSAVDFEKVQKQKFSLFKKAFLKFQDDQVLNEEFIQFAKKEESWLEDLTTFLVLTEQYGHDWSLWPQNLSEYSSKEVQSFKNQNKEEIVFQKFLQFIFDKQWMALREYASKRNISLFGDIPIFVSFHSMEVWKDPNLFKLNEKHEMEIETGAPPDAFSKDGQKWGTPNYNWKAMEDKQFSWWIERINYQKHLFDILRLDHFLGFVHVWESPKEDAHSRNGQWVDTPGDQLFSKLTTSLPDLPLIAEDLGETCDEVFALRDKYGFPGMKILQFAFGEKGDRGHHPENYTGHEVAYTGTHDNNTTLGHFQDLVSSEDISKKVLKSYTDEIYSFSKETELNWALIDIAFNSKALLSIIPMQDILSLGSEGRMNLPGTISPKNWSWRLNELPSQEISSRIKEIAKTSERSIC